MEIQTEKPSDASQVRHLHISSFPDHSEANLVDEIRANGKMTISLVALDRQKVIGHVLFSPMQANFHVLGLAPVAVASSYRCQGIAANLIEAGLRMAKEQGWEGAFVLGNPDYYQRFGFNLDLAAAYSCKYSGPHLMALSFNDGSFSEPSGPVEYDDAFG